MHFWKTKKYCMGGKINGKPLMTVSHLVVAHTMAMETPDSIIEYSRVI